MSNLIIERLLAKTKRADLPPFGAGDTVRVHVKIKEGDKERLQAFEGVVIHAPRVHRPVSQCAKSALAKAWSAFSPCTPRSSTTWTCCGLPKFGAPSSITCAVFAAKRPAYATQTSE